MSYEADSKRGVQVLYGPVSTQGKFGRSENSDGREKVLEYVFSYDALPVPGTSYIQAQIPAYAKILDCTLEVLTAFAGGTSYAIGLAQADGTEIDNDGLFTGLATASINARGKVVRGDGVLVPYTYVKTSDAGAEQDALLPAYVSIGSAAGELKVVATGTFTAGKAKVRIKYLAEGPGA